jgi:hypothetical protein
MRGLFYQQMGTVASIARRLKDKMFSNQCALQVLGRPQDSDLSLIGDIKGASDMSVQDAVLFAWRGCKQLNSAVTVPKIDVRL